VNAKKVLWRVVQLALVILITWGIVRSLAPELTKVTLEDFSHYRPAPWRVLLATIVLTAFYLLHAWLWRLMTIALGQKAFGYRNALRIYFVSGLGRYIPGRLWQIAGMALMAQRAGLSPVAATAASLIAQLAFITSGLLYLALVLPSWGGLAPVLVAMIALAVMTGSYAGRHWIGVHVKRLKPAIDMLDRVKATVALGWWIGYAISWIILGVAFVLFVTAFVTLDPAQQRHVAGAVAAAYLGGLLAFFSIAGLGVREAVMGSLLLSVMAPPAALVVSVASRLWFTVGEILPILFSKSSNTN
jgi:glycosyltransferase 2 family protein